MRTRFIRHVRDRISGQLSPRLFCHLANFRNRLRGKSQRIKPAKQKGLYEVTDGQSRILISQRNRHNRYKRGINHQVDVLAADYHLHEINIRPGSLFIDCGANVGELGIWARNRNLRYLAVEPEELEALCCDLNNFEGDRRTVRKALWSENSALTFYSKPETADSSLIEIGEYGGKRTIEALRLETLVRKMNLGRIHILKVEAEGAEPEVLEGAKNCFCDIEYIAIDCGYERGIAKESTFVEVNNILTGSGFRMLKARFDRVTMLYQNKNVQ